MLRAEIERPPCARDALQRWRSCLEAIPSFRGGSARQDPVAFLVLVRDRPSGGEQGRKCCVTVMRPRDVWGGLVDGERRPGFADIRGAGLHSIDSAVPEGRARLSGSSVLRAWLERGGFHLALVVGKEPFILCTRRWSFSPNLGNVADTPPANRDIRY